MDLVLNLLAVSRPIKPGNLALLSEPSHLTLCVASRVTLNYTNRPFPRVTGIEIRYDMPVPDRLKRLRARRNTVCKQSADFLHQTRFEHLANAYVNTSV